MATLNDWIKQMQQPSGVADPYQHLKKSPMELLIMQQAMAQRADPSTLAGFAVGKLLRGLFNDWKERYDARGLLNDINALKDPNQRAEALANLEKTNSPLSQTAQRYLREDNGTKWGNLAQPSAPQAMPSVNPTAGAVKEAPAKLLGNTDWSKGNDYNFSEYNSNTLEDMLKRAGAGWGNGLRL